MVLNFILLFSLTLLMQSSLFKQGACLQIKELPSTDGLCFVPVFVVSLTCFCCSSYIPLSSSRDPNRAPGRRSLNEWPMHSPHRKQFLELNVNYLHQADKSRAIGRGPRAKECAFWKEYLPELVRKTCEYTRHGGSHSANQISRKLGVFDRKLEGHSLFY